MKDIHNYRSKHIIHEILNKWELKQLVKCTNNIKHEAMIMLAYSSGLRLNELVALKVSDIDFVNLQIRVTADNSRKNRMTILSESMLDTLEIYLQQSQPDQWLFEDTGGCQYSAIRVQHIVEEAVKKAGIERKISCDTLQQSFVAHLIEAGINYRYIKSLLGHESKKANRNSGKK